ncbi:hypothetical protein [Mycolicibacterium smegmatis]|uniref:Low molecular weight antigen MTB12 n=3 Tax=Mycolicibacterium smegmatis TaxID=1772 RepID=A0QZ55_MYCS2|nr:hypothetical protein [Mycolicibacterium smegmatis]ABK72456.1 Low molecular weight antigen MTB12 [Mycolicibacterium smegmatis MC2 155]AFP40272.1 Low molecular weight antigen CFP2 (Low molecular weight protein antigen 2) (CFP-2) [Mycolicibacterium smegmatis MC2 155]AIU09020.1 hypothetical protein LJ00_19395 [Mycolicibacterium smegmatis MC2 155]AIU15645.1 hypothetical protein LI99_19400 [Mycolicibacterium smegmatis]AIU22268.1 hypothetical protein LI98_19405 [Mycolicibacterium smegmatis]
MTPKSLVTGFITAAAAAAVVSGAAAGVTSIASSGMSTSPAIQPVVFGAPLPQQPAPELEAPLIQTLQALASGGSFSGKAPYIQGGIGRVESIAADRAYNRAAADGKFPLTFTVNNVDQQGPVAYADVTATAATGGTATQNIQFVAGPSPTGWQISKGSALSLLSSVG